MKKQEFEDEILLDSRSGKITIRKINGEWNQRRSSDETWSPLKIETITSDEFIDLLGGWYADRVQDIYNQLHAAN